MEKDLPHTLVFYESPFRLHTLLADAREMFGDRMAAVSIELTKQFEKTVRGTLGELCGRFRNWNARGEVTVVIAGNNPKFTALGNLPDDTMGDDDGEALGEDV